MLNDYSKRAKTAQNRINDIENHFQSHQRNIYKKMYKNKSPAIFNHYRYEEPNYEQYIKHMHYIKPPRNSADYHNEEYLERTMKNMGAKGSYFHNEFRNMNISVEGDRNLTQKANYTFTNQNQDKSNERYFNLEKKNINKNNILKSENENIIINYKKIYEKQKYEGREKKYPPKFYRNKKNKENKENVIQPVAQKICNIIIKGETKSKKLITVSKSGRKFVNNIIEENVSQGSTVPDKINDFNLNSKQNNHIQNFQKIKSKKNNETEEIAESEERKITISDSKREVYKNNKKKIKNNIEREREENYEDYEEQEENIRNNNDEYHGHTTEEPYIEGEGENEEEYEQEDQVQVAQEERPEHDEEIEEDHKQAEELLVDEENKDEKIYDNNYDQNMQQYNNENDNNNDNEEENRGINEGDIDKLEEIETQQIEIHNYNNNRKEKKNNILQLQKGDEIELESIQEKKPIMQIQKVEEIQSKSDKSTQKNNNVIFNIISDKKIEIIGIKKPLILEMNTESNLELIKEVHEPIIEIEKVESLEQLQNKPKKSKKNIFSVSNNKDNDVDIIHGGEPERELILEIQKVQNFVEPRNKERKIKKNIPLKISQLKDANFVLEKIEEEEPEFEIQKIEYFEKISNKKRKNKKKSKPIKFKIIKLKDNNIEIIGAKSISVCNENKIEIKNAYNSKKIKKSNYKKYKISKRITYQYKTVQVINDAISAPKESRFLIKGKPKKMPKKVRNSIKREITYFYKSPIVQKKKELSIGGNIKNTIKPTTSPVNNNNELKNQLKTINNGNSSLNSRKLSSASMSNKNNSAMNLNLNMETKKEEKKEDKKKEKNIKAFKTITIVSSNLLNLPSQPVKQVYSSVRRKNIVNKKTDKTSPPSHSPSSNSFKEKILLTEGETSERYSRNKMTNMISPSRKTEQNKIEDSMDNNKKLRINNSYTNKSVVIKSENSIVKTQANYRYRNNNKNEIPKNPLPKDNNNNDNNSTINSNKNNKSNSNSRINDNNTYNNNTYNNAYNGYKNKSHTITVFSNNISSKNIERTYISSKLNQRNESSNKDNNNNNSFSNVGRVYVSSTHKSTNNDIKSNNKKIESSKSVNTIYISTNLKKDDKKDIPVNNNVYFSSSVSTKKKEKNKVLNNNQMYVSSNSTNYNNQSNLKNKNEIKTNINRIVVISSSNSPATIKTSNMLESKPEPKKIFLNENISANKDIDMDNNKKDDNDTENNNINNKDNNENNIITDIKTEKTETKIIIDNKNDNKESTTKTEIETVIEDKKDVNPIEDKQIQDNNNNNINSIFDKYNINTNTELSDITKSYLDSYMNSNRPELSDFSKQFLSSNVTDNYTSRPELSNITRAYLLSQSPVDKTEDK